MIFIFSMYKIGLATTELVNTLLQALPPLGPVFLLIKEFLKSQNLTDAFTGGLPSYGLVLLLCIPILKHVQIENKTHATYATLNNNYDYSS